MRRKDCIASASYWLIAERWTSLILPYSIEKEEFHEFWSVDSFPNQGVCLFFIDCLCMTFSTWLWGDQGWKFVLENPYLIPSPTCLRSEKSESHEAPCKNIHGYEDLYCRNCHYSYFGMIFVLTRDSYYLKTDLEIQITGGLLFPILIYSPRVIPKHINYRHKHKFTITYQSLGCLNREAQLKLNNIMQ